MNAHTFYISFKFKHRSFNAEQTAKRFVYFLSIVYLYVRTALPFAHVQTLKPKFLSIYGPSLWIIRVYKNPHQRPGGGWWGLRG